MTPEKERTAEGTIGLRERNHARNSGNIYREPGHGEEENRKEKG